MSKASSEGWHLQGGATFCLLSLVGFFSLHKFWLFQRAFLVDSKLPWNCVTDCQYHISTAKYKIGMQSPWPILGDVSIPTTSQILVWHYVRWFLGGGLHGRAPGQQECKHGARRGEPCPGGSWHMVLWLLPGLPRAASSREPASVRLCLSSCCSLSTPCMEQGSQSNGNAERERAEACQFQAVLLWNLVVATSVKYDKITITKTTFN